MARKKKADSGGASGAPAWMNTYGDMVTLLLCFFVLLYSFSTIDAKKFVDLAASMQNAFNIQPGAPDNSSRPGLITGSMGDGGGDASVNRDSTLSEKSSRVLALVQEAIKSENLEEEIQAVITERGVEIALSEQLLFVEGSARLRPEAMRMLYKIGRILDTLPNLLSVEGHTDSAILENSIYRDNWGLSAARASAVASYFNGSLGISGSRLRAVGFGSSAPIVPNVTEEMMRLNRRVDIVVMSEYSVR
ncbi:MAG: OmpA family protein [Synergistaceae bacterium]|jgi:chemotaxis protein MotB|nr:OmpA family protein [Synergistaceae bacterium]